MSDRKKFIEVLTTAMEKPEIANALIQRVINTLNARRWFELTDEEILEAIEESNSVGVIDMARAIESKIKEKNHD